MPAADLAIDWKELAEHAVTLGAVILGFVLGEGARIIKEKRSRNSIKQALLAEIADARSWLLRNRLTLLHLMRLFVHKQNFDVGPSKVPTTIYDRHFADVALTLTADERVSFASIYSDILLAERQTSTIERSLIEDKPIQAARALQILEVAHHNTCTAIWKIRYHLQSRNRLQIHMFTAEDAKRLDEEIVKEFRETLLQAKSMSLEEVRSKAYEE